MPNSSLLFVKEPQWSSSNSVSARQIPPKARTWLFEAGSITQRLRSVCSDEVLVTVLRQHWEKPFLGEKRLLGLPLQARCLIREVLLHSGGRPLVLARTVMPTATLRGVHRNLSRLGSRPLGEVIFADPRLQRLEMQVARLRCRDWSPQLLERVALSEPLWGRRTVYAIRDRHLLVSEFFLPELA
ncbi:MAG: chorismate--pyruvate lyase family protein [Gammaproteobacteria bacterium]